MTLVQIQIPQKLWERLQQTGRPVEEVVVEALELVLDEEQNTSGERLRKRETLVRRLITSGAVIDPDTWHDSAAQEWLSRPADERMRMINEMNQDWHPGSLAAQTVTEGRR